ncbi:integrase catalytic domain-containing protein [Trichonephila clavipes]|nr:integrase catalytic domain-containing protein [Trichonephila clavipes]
MNRLLNLTPVRKSFDVIALRNLYDQLEINIRGLESLEISPDSYSCLLFPIIMKAIPPDLALEYNKKHNETQSQITDLIAYLRSEVESRERTELLVKPHDLELKNKNSYSNTKYFERTSHSYPQSNRRVQGHSRFHPSHKSFSSANELLTAAFSDCLFCFENTHMSDLCSDFYWSLTHRIKRLDSSLVAVETRLGWSLQGRCDERSDCTSVHLVHSEDESISTELRRFWEIESLGILDKGSMTLGNGDEEILSEFDKSVNFVDGRYRVNLPWKPQDVIDDYVREGIVERTSCDSLLDSQGFYLPHHAVIRSDKTTSHIRIVFDGSAHEDGQSSLNQSLYTGPNLHPNILELLLCFRKSPVAFTADDIQLCALLNYI